MQSAALLLFCTLRYYTTNNIDEGVLIQGHPGATETGYKHPTPIIYNYNIQRREFLATAVL